MTDNDKHDRANEGYDEGVGKHPQGEGLHKHEHTQGD
jgi:hypothetical protein|tara:strand:- start:2927 stop:3037 length:111 start_codon:yes stop_codon:yes gene_type:complete